MDMNVERGRTLVLTVIVIILTLSAAVIILTNYSTISPKFPVQIARFVVNIIFCIFLYRGVRWIRIFLIILLIVAGIFSSVTFLLSPALNFPSLIIFIMGVGYLFSAYLLIFNRSVKSYFNFKSSRIE